MYPVFLNVVGKLCVVVGGGQVAERKVRKLLKSGAKVLIVSPEVTQWLKKLIRSGRIKHLGREYRSGDIPSHSFMVFECVGDKKLAKLIKNECDAKRVLFNSATYPEISDFFVPASVRRGDIIIAISTGGRASAFSRALREKIEKEVIDSSIPEKLRIIEKIRKEFLKRGKKTSDEDRFLLEISRMAMNDGSSLKNFVLQVLKKSKKYGMDIKF